MTTTPSPLQRRRIGWRVLTFDMIDSTNTHALALATDPDNHGVVIIAGAQTAGRGQHGRTWTATPGSSVLMSALVFPPPELGRPVLLTAWAAVSVCEVIEQAIGRQARIKWPNDVLIDDRKICGILIEQRSLGPHVATVVGIGLNVTQSASDFAAAGLHDAGSLAMFGQVPDLPAVTRLLIAQFDAAYERLEMGDTTSLEQRWRDRLGLIGAMVLVEGTKLNCQGRLQDVSFAGARLQAPDRASPLHMLPEEIRHIHALKADR